MQYSCDKFIRPSTYSTFSILSVLFYLLHSGFCLSLSQLLSAKGSVQPRIPSLVTVVMLVYFYFCPIFFLSCPSLHHIGSKWNLVDAACQSPAGPLP